MLVSVENRGLRGAHAFLLLNTSLEPIEKSAFFTADIRPL
jgi:hypothetical protein